MCKFFNILLLSFLFISCSRLGGESEHKELLLKYEALEKQNAELKKRDIEKDKAIKTFLEDLDEISANLEIIKQKENLINIATVDVELKVGEIEKINADVLIIIELLEKNRRTIENLGKDLSASLIYSSELKQVINSLNLVILRYEKEIQDLNDQLFKMNLSFIELQVHFDSISLANKMHEDEIETYKNTGYYVVGTAAELVSKDIIVPIGGILGIGGSYVLNEDFDKSEFVKININEVKNIPLSCKFSKLISVHPSNSYKFDGPSDFINNLVITRQKEFWSTSKYLVILKK